MNSMELNYLKFKNKSKMVNGCLEWGGPLDRAGYGVLNVGTKKYKASRAAWIIERGDIGHGLVVMHHCDNPPCIDIRHLSVATTAKNVADKIRKGRHSNSVKAHCVHGHKFSEGNIYWKNTPTGRVRNCRECALISARKRYAAFCKDVGPSGIRKGWSLSR